MLSGKGYDKIYNLSGGIKAWGKEVAVGPEFTGLHLFPEEISAEDAIITGFSLEMGLRDFYLLDAAEGWPGNYKGTFR